MKGRSFDTFQVNSGNQEGYTVCRRIAALEEMGPALVVLLGPEGCGKSHLLWSIAKHVRAGTLPAGLALITPDEIPDKVKGLVENYQPLQGRRAMLLVDGLERFDKDVRRLDAIIEVFLACQHPVVVATSVHPNRLGRLGVPLVNRLASARFVNLEGRISDGDGSALERIRSLEENALDLQRQRDALQAQVAESTTALEAARISANDTEARSLSVLKKSEATTAALTSVQSALDAVTAEKQALETRCAALQVEVDGVRSQLKRVASVLQEARDERAVAEAQIAAFRDEAEYALAQQALLQAKLASSRMELEESGATESTLAAAEQWIAEALKTLDNVGRESDRRGNETKDSVDSDWLEIPAGNNPLIDGIRRIYNDQQHLRSTLSATRQHVKGIEFEWEKTRKVLAIQTAEMDALRYEAASQVAQANIQAGELDKRIVYLESALESLRLNRREGGTAPNTDGKTWSMALENMQAQLLALRETRAQSSANYPKDEQAQFDADFFEALPEDFESEMRADEQVPLPGDNSALKDAVSDALGGPQEDLDEETEHKSIDLDS